MFSISINTNDSPKLYFAFFDIYGNVLNVAATDLIELKYSVSRVVSGKQYALDDFTDVEIPLDNWHSESAPFPSNIKGVSASSGGYNLELFPYYNKDGVWTSPFTLTNSTYYLTVYIAYYMSDAALEESAVYKRSVTVAITTGSV